MYERTYLTVHDWLLFDQKDKDRTQKIENNQLSVPYN